MPAVLDHPMIERMNRNGFLGSLEEENTIEVCKCCDAPLSRGETVVEFYDYLFCDEDCLTEKFSDDPSAFGMEKENCPDRKRQPNENNYKEV